MINCPVCGIKAAEIRRGRYVGLIQCFACGWSMDLDKWNHLSPEEKKKLRHKQSLIQRIKSRLGG